MGNQAGEREQARIDSANEMQAYREYNRWDNGNVVYYQDIVELILLHQNSVEFTVTKLSGTMYKPTTTPYTWYTRDNIRNELFESNALHYKATLIRDPLDAGHILGYSFKAYNTPPN